MHPTKTGGPAFPSTITDDSLHVQGMTLRDYFAAKAVQGFIQSSAIRGIYTKGIGTPTNAELATAAYDLADAMLRARETSTTKEKT